ncbi:MAG TPA: hypothetical protein VF077_08955 [Nitrospiraceae bacterium]
MARVTWSEDDWAKVIAFGKAQFQPKMHAPERFDAAQRNTLPKEKWRPKGNPNAVSEFNMRLRIAGLDLGNKRIRKIDPYIVGKLRRVGLEIPETLPAAKQAEPPRKAGPQVESSQPVAEEKAASALPPTHPDPVVEAAVPGASLPPDPLADVLAGSLEPVLLKMLASEKVKARLLEIIAEHYLPKVVVEQPTGAKIIQLGRKPRLPKIVVVTKLKGHQTARLATEFAGLLDLYVWNTSRSIQELKANLMHCNAAVCTINNVSHGAMQMAKSRAPAFVPCQAGVETIRNALLELIPAELQPQRERNGK